MQANTQTIVSNISAALAKQIIEEHENHPALLEEKAAIFYVRSVLAFYLNQLEQSFPKNTLHAVAIKTNDHPEVLKYIAERGFGLEAASLEEVKKAKEAGLSNHKIVFDSPVKTRKEISYCHEHLPGILVNVNALEELDRYPAHFSGRLGLRINPLIESDTEDIFNVSTKTSKFGIPISRRTQIIQACMLRPEICGLHIHIGSAIKDFSFNIKAISLLVDLATEINALRTKSGISSRINVLDIGGGIHFEQAPSHYTVANFTQELKKIANIDQFQLVTEYGAFVHKHCSFVLSNIEYVVETDPRLPANVFLHVGADLFLRKVYSSLNISYPYSIIHQVKGEKPEKLYNIVGPLCFAGDILYENLSLPQLQEGDYFIIHDTGANTNSMWSKHCSREVPGFVMV